MKDLSRFHSVYTKYLTDHKLDEDKEKIDMRNRFIMEDKVRMKLHQQRRLKLRRQGVYIGRYHMLGEKQLNKLVEQEYQNKVAKLKVMALKHCQNKGVYVEFLQGEQYGYISDEFTEFPQQLPTIMKYGPTVSLSPPYAENFINIHQIIETFKKRIAAQHPYDLEESNKFRNWCKNNFKKIFNQPERIDTYESSVKAILNNDKYNLKSNNLLF